MNNDYKCQVPILMMLFNRPDTTRAVFEQIRKVKPARLFLAQNGPRLGYDNDQKLLEEVRKIVMNVDWQCDVRTNFLKTNIGMNPQWQSSLNWFFEDVDQGIILEDDCVANESFFQYCEEMLNKYQNEERVMQINGSNFQFGHKRGAYSYYFSKYPHVWGWATWKRAWNKFDDSLSSLPTFIENKIIDQNVFTKRERLYWIEYFQKIKSGRFNDSATKWVYSIWKNDGICIAPNVNMISNIGFGISAGNTFFKDKNLNQKTVDIRPITHSDILKSEVPDKEADRYTFKMCYKTNFFKKAIYKLTLISIRLLNKK